MGMDRCWSLVYGVAIPSAHKQFKALATKIGTEPEHGCEVVDYLAVWPDPHDPTEEEMRAYESAYAAALKREAYAELAKENEQLSRECEALHAILATFPPPACACGARAMWLEVESSTFRCNPCHAQTAQTGSVRLPERGDPMQPATVSPPPVTAVAAIIVRDGKVCLIRSKKNGYVLTPGGRLEPGETLDEALIREIREETGLTVTRIGRLLGVDKQPTYTLYIIEADADGELVAGDDAAEAWWGTAEEVRDSAKPRDYPFILDVLHAQQRMKDLEALDDAVRYVCASADREIEFEGTRLVSGKALDAVRAERDRLQRACAEGLPREVLLCPACGRRHIDGANGTEYASKPHHTHLCAACGHVWDHGRVIRCAG